MQNAPRGLVGRGPVCDVFGGRDLPSSLAVVHGTPCEVHLFEAEPALRAMAWGTAPTLYGGSASCAPGAGVVSSREACARASGAAAPKAVSAPTARTHAGTAWRRRPARSIGQ